MIKSVYKICTDNLTLSREDSIFAPKIRKKKKNAKNSILASSVTHFIRFLVRTIRHKKEIKHPAWEGRSNTISHGKT